MLVETHSQALSRHNNFDLIRLLAAYQVVAMHGGEYLHAPVPKILTFFPGVSIFFIVSGFLVTASLAHCATLREYARNRILRIYPCLWVMTAVTLVLLMALGQLTEATPRLKLTAYVLGQITFFQDVDGGLGMFRGFGTGGVNGVLWTLTTELQFYVFLPLMFVLANRLGGRRIWFLSLLLCASLLLYHSELPAWTDLARVKSSTARLLLTLLYTSLPTHLFGFLTGVLCYLKLPVLMPWMRGKALYWLSGYLLYVLAVWHGFGLAGWNLEKNLVCMILQRVLLAGVIFSVAFSAPGLAQMLLRGNDISYGIYVYHMLVINTMLQWGLRDSWAAFAALAGITAVIALGSWRLVERPALRLKRRIRIPVDAPGAAAATPRPSS